MNNKTLIKEDYADFRLNIILRKLGSDILSKILKYAIPKPEETSFYDYLSQNENISMKNFDSSQKTKLKNFKESSNFDITLLFKLYINAGEGLASSNDSRWRTEGEFEYNLGKIKKYRNDLVHATVPIKMEDLHPEILALEKLFISFLESAQLKFQIEQQIILEEIGKVKESIQDFLKMPLSHTEIDDYLSTEGVLESKNRYKRLSVVNPVDFFIGIEFSSEIDEIFVTLEISKLESYKGGQSIEFNSLLKLFFDTDTSLIVIEGVAGSGKTTLSKYILTQWLNNSSEIYGLNHFTFLIYLQCNNTYINSVHDLLISIMPETSRKFDKDHLAESVFSQNVLVLVDGVDEAQTGAKTVLRELFEKSQGHKIKFFCTSRPEKVHWIYRIKKDLKCGTLSIIGVAKNNRRNFVKKLYSFYSRSIAQEISPLNKVLNTLDHLSRKFLIADLKLPLCLSLFTYLCTVEPKRIEKLNSTISLYNELFIALKDRLFTRASAKNDLIFLDLEEDDIRDTIDDCFNIFCEEALDCLTSDRETFRKDALQKIKLYSNKIGLTMKDILSSFLVVKIVLTPLGIEEIVGFPHKGLKEFFAAKAAVKSVANNMQLTNIFPEDLPVGPTSNTPELIPSVEEKAAPPPPPPQFPDILSRMAMDITIHKKSKKSILPIKPRNLDKLLPTKMSLDIKKKSIVPIKPSNQPDLNTGFMKYQNIIQHIAGILVIEKMVTEDRVNEILRLLRKAGVYSADQWLSIVAALNYHFLACEYVLMKFKKLEITEDMLETFQNILKYGCPQEVVFKISCTDQNSVQKLKKVFSALNKYECNISLNMKENFRFPSIKAADEIISVISAKNSKCNLKSFQGNLEKFGVQCLPEYIHFVALGIANQQQAEALKIIQPSSSILFLKINVLREVESQYFPTLPQVIDFHLILSGVQATFADVLWVRDVVYRLSSNKKYGKITFNLSTLDSKMMEKILKKLEGLQLSLGVLSENTGETAGGIYVNTTGTISKNDEMEFHGFCRRVWGCRFKLVTEESIYNERIAL